MLIFVTYGILIPQTLHGQNQLCINDKQYIEDAIFNEKISCIKYKYDNTQIFIDGEFQFINPYFSDSILHLKSSIQIDKELTKQFQTWCRLPMLSENNSINIRDVEIQIGSLALKYDNRIYCDIRRPFKCKRIINKRIREIGSISEAKASELSAESILRYRELFLLTFLMMNSKNAEAEWKSLFENRINLQALGPEYGEEALTYLSILQELGIISPGSGYIWGGCLCPKH